MMCIICTFFLECCLIMIVVGYVYVGIIFVLFRGELIILLNKNLGMEMYI